ncbi:DUF4291 domain-containing protein [Acinetobacter haemolyticus]|uniref:DUF4291 domain-containing protein n=1 Tax=Acinetobacter haemolyticus TaxID=29430 RepID=UPI002A6A214B|nr:DUF4291 domain-containing protein [Acinetobacter haemolyticus]WPO68377.1 DUF4291 domain-containing protein [Acinetobacter haemolyticus]
MNMYNEKVIRASQTSSTIRIYQAFSQDLVDYAFHNSGFINNPFFKTTRMTWIKPSFLWMMYRSGWGLKDERQQRILGIDITKAGFDWALSHSCSSHKPLDLSTEEWKKLKVETPVRIQWDPERNLLLEPLKYRTIQIGLSGVAIEHYINDWVTNITDLTHTAQEIYHLVLNRKIEKAKKLLPEEKIYLPNITKDIVKL